LLVEVGALATWRNARLKGCIDTAISAITNQPQKDRIQESNDNPSLSVMGQVTWSRLFSFFSAQRKDSTCKVWVPWNFLRVIIAIIILERPVYDDISLVTLYYLMLSWMDRSRCRRRTPHSLWQPWPPRLGRQFHLGHVCPLD
jgi:hypothetical protein